jgi:hypothetical protein
MAIITAPYLLDAGRQADRGYFCLGCRDEKEEKTRHFRNKYTREDMLEHVARYGPVEETPRIPGRFMHVKHNCSRQELEDEMSALKRSLEDTSFRGGAEPVHK